MKWLGIDVGGTFTDFVVYDETTAELVVGKTASTPPDYSQGMLTGVSKLTLDLSEVSRLVHGTTIATNTILERSGAVAAVITTRGFRDILEVGRGDRLLRSNLYNVKAVRPDPLVPRSLRFAVDERTLYDGTVLRDVQVGDVEAIVLNARKRGVEAIAVCFLHSYANGMNERVAKETIQRTADGLFVCTSSEVLPEYREYERFSTTLLNVYVGPRVGRYLWSLGAALKGRGYLGDVTIMTSNGGTMGLQRAGEYPVQSVLSGPAAGVIGAVFVAAEAGCPNIVTYDMGGTSTDVCLVRDMDIPMVTEGSIGAFPNKVPQIEINSVGAGGGSIGWVDDGRFLMVGPQSAGALPGPACYGRGGTEPTVTDANVLLGRLKSSVLAGEIRLDADLARAAVDGLARRLDGMDTLRMAEGIVKLAVAKMVGAIKEVSVMRGHDPRDFVLFAYGGAGPMHATLIARELSIARVVVPPFPGNFSAFGLLVASIRHDYVRTILIPTSSTTVGFVHALFDTMRQEAKAQLGMEGFGEEALRFDAQLDMRYAGQAFELSVPFGHDLTSMADLDRAFYAAHERRYAHYVEEPVEIVNCRLTAYGVGPKPRFRSSADASWTLASALAEDRQVYFEGSFLRTPVFRRDLLPVDTVLPAPAIIEELGATTIVTPGFMCAVDRFGNLVLESRE
jgi:N-methylhydantoinase A